MAGLTRSSSDDRPIGWSAVFSVLLGLVALAAIPVAVLVAERYERITLLEASVAIAPAFVFAFGAIFLGRRGRRLAERSLNRVRGYKTALVGRILGYMALYLALTATISVATYYVLRRIS